MCKIDGCNTESMYKEMDVCQMHYFRFMRNGTYETVRTRKMRHQNPAGYFLLFDPNHCLAQAGGYVYEHRAVAYDKYGDTLPDCELCGKKCSWELYTTHIDHKDEDVTNNAPENLRPLCNGCNTKRGRPAAIKYKGSIKIEFDGEVKTPQEWSRDSRVNVSGAAIRHRKRRGLSDYDALFKDKATHKLAKELAEIQTDSRVAKALIDRYSKPQY